MPPGQPRSERLNFPIVLRQYEERPATEKMSWITGDGSKTLHAGDAVVIEGEKIKYCFRYFEAANGKPPVIVKQCFPIETTIEEIHQALMKKRIEET